MALKDQQLRIMEFLDELSLGVKVQTLGKDKDCPPIAFPTTADHMVSMMDMPQTSFDALPYLSSSQPGHKVGTRPYFV